MRIRIPANGWHPRPYQRPTWDYLERGGKRAIAIWHRRSGKDEVFLHRACIAAHERRGNYWHMLPEYAQARKAVWDAINPHTGRRRIDDVFPPEIRDATRDHEMTIRLKCGSTWQLVGSDNYNSLMGSPPVGITFSEYALSNPTAWGYIRPILLENGGWAGFNTTPRGHNHAERLYRSMARDENAHASLLTVDDTRMFSAAMLAKERQDMIDEHGEQYGDALFRQEYHCSFDAAIIGSIWGDLIEKAEREGRIGEVPYDPALDVFTAWDLGYDDDTAIWFFQVLHGEMRFIDCYFSSGEPVSHYAKVVLDRGYRYGAHWLPHDAKPKTLAANGRSILEQLIECGLRPCNITPTLSVQDGIQAARKMLPKARFDVDKCADGLDAARQYRREYDPDKRMFRDKPEHDWTSHFADAIRGAAIIWRNPKEVKQEQTTEEKLAGVTMGARVKATMDKRRRAREEMAI